MVKLLFDLVATQPGPYGEFHGGSEYAKTLFDRLVKTRGQSEIHAIYKAKTTFDPALKTLADEQGIRLIDLSDGTTLQSVLDAGQYDKFYTALATSETHVDFGKTEFLFTIHGLRPIEQPTDRYEFKYRVGLQEKVKPIVKGMFRGRYVASKKEHYAQLLKAKSPKVTVVAASYHTKYAILFYYPWTRPEQIKVLYSPPTRVSTLPGDPERIKQFGVTPRGYFLIVSGNRWLKNAYRTVTALDSLFSRFAIDKKVLVLGVPDPRIYPVRNPDKFRFAPYVDALDLAAAYEAAYCLIYNTLNEGFGYPPLESMTHGTPVITSSVTSISEVCGDAALYCNPYSLEEISNRILYLLNEPDVWETYAERGRARSQLIAQKQTAMLNEICQTLLSDV